MGDSRFPYCTTILANDAVAQQCKSRLLLVVGAEGVEWKCAWGDGGRLTFCFRDQIRAILFQIDLVIDPIARA